MIRLLLLVCGFGLWWLARDKWQASVFGMVLIVCAWMLGVGWMFGDPFLQKQETRDAGIYSAAVAWGLYGLILFRNWLRQFHSWAVAWGLFGLVVMRLRDWVRARL